MYISLLINIINIVGNYIAVIILQVDVAGGAIPTLVSRIVAVFGTSQIAANSVAGSIDQIAVVMINAINLGIVTVVGQCVGTNDYNQATY